MSLASNIQTLLKTSFSDYLYVRASSLEQVDRDLIRESFNNLPVIIHYDLAEISVEQGMSNLEEVYPVQIAFGLQADLDELSDNLDAKLEACKEIADKFWDLMLQDDNFSQVVRAKQGEDNYILTPFVAFEIGGENICGYTFKSDLRIHRSSQTIDS